MEEILRRRCDRLVGGERLFKGVAKEHVYNMAIRQGAPKFMLHDLRKMLANLKANAKRMQAQATMAQAKIKQK